MHTTNQKRKASAFLFFPSNSGLLISLQGPATTTARNQPMIALRRCDFAFGKITGRMISAPTMSTVPGVGATNGRPRGVSRIAQRAMDGEGKNPPPLFRHGQFSTFHFPLRYRLAAM